MATTANVPVEVYLQADYEHDCDYVDGHLEERAAGEYDHATWQTILATFLTMRAAEWGIRARTELRVRVSPTRYRVPDVTLLDRDAPIEQIITHAPLAVFEVLSPEDRMPRVMERLADYEAMGIEAIWVVDPKTTGYLRYASGRLSPEEIFILPGSGRRVAMEEIARLID